jgi:hypothetical protein
MVTKMSLLGISSAGLFYESGAVINEYLCPIDGIIESDELTGIVESDELTGIIESDELTGIIESDELTGEIEC